MPSSSVFQVLSVSPVGLATLRLSFSKPPKIVDATATNDALNFANYTISGPDAISVFDVLPVQGNTSAIDLLLSNTLVIGNWTLNAANIVSANLAETIYTGTVSFGVTQTYIQDVVSPGTNNDSSAAILRKFFHPALKGPGWNSILAALATGDETNWTNAQLAFSQLYLSTASGVYLNRRAAESGQLNPVNVGLTDELFRKLAITTKTRALSQEAILEVLEVFYGIEATKANIISTQIQPFALKDGDELSILIDEKLTARVPFVRSHYANIALATAEEVSAEINRTLTLLGSNAYAIDNAGAVQIYSGSRGLTSSVRIIGGRAQIALQFPTVLFNTSFTSVTWDVALSPDVTGNLRFTETTGTYFDLTQIQVGDYVYVYGNEFSTCDCNGTFKIQAVNVYYSGATLVQWFEISNPSGVASSSIVQASQLGLNFFRPTRFTIYNDPRHVIVGQNEAGRYLDIIIPATTQAVNRFPGIAAYLNQTPSVSISSLSRDQTGLVTATTSTVHHLVPGNQIIVSNVLPSGAAAPITTGTPSGAFSSDVASGTTNASIQSTSSQSTTVAAYNHKVVHLAAGQLMVVGGQTQTDATHVTPLTHPIIFEVTSSAILTNGGRQDSYTWKNLVTDTYTIANRAFGVSVQADQTVLATGGTTGDDVTGTATDAWDLISYSDSATSISSGTMPAQLATHAQCSRISGNALVAGGWTTAGVPLATAYKFTGTTQVWSAIAPMNLARMYPQAIECPNIPNSVLVVGGLTAGGIQTNKCEIYDTLGDVWSWTGFMSYARSNFGMTSLPDGRILVVGGTGFNPTQSTTPSPLNTCEIFDPNSNLWSPIKPMVIARDNPSVTYIPSLNRVYVTGGGTTIIEILDLKTMKWRQSVATTAGLLGSVSNYTGTDTVVIVGGLSGSANSPTIAEDFIIVPGSGSQWSGGLNRVATVLSTPLTTILTYQTDDFANYDKFVSSTVGTITPMKASPAPKGVPGPFTYDVKKGLSVSPSTASGKLNQVLNTNIAYNTIELDTSIHIHPALDFPDLQGFIVINYGYDNQVGPIKYLGRFSETAIRIDPGFKMPSQQLIGSAIYWLSSRSPFIPPKNKLIGNFYATGSAVGRIAAVDNVNKILAAGTDVKMTVKYPGDVGLGGEGYPNTGPGKLSDAAIVWGGDDVAQALKDAQTSP